MHFKCQKKKLRFCGKNNDNINFSPVGWTLVWIGLVWTNGFRKFHGPGLDGIKLPWTGRVGLVLIELPVDLDGLDNFLNGLDWMDF